MQRRVRAVSSGEKLTYIEHLDELRWRIIQIALAFSVALAVAMWQNHALLDYLNAPLPKSQEPITLGVAEAFTATLTVSAWASIFAVLPFMLYHVYAFVLPAFSPDERRVALPLLLMAPVLFLAGAAFAYYAIVPAALNFLLNFNDSEFNVQIRAREYYSFLAMTLISIGVLFQIPVGVLIATRLDIVTPTMLRKNRRYAVLVIAVVAMLLPGTDPVTMVISMAPMLVLYELSIILAATLGRRSEAAAERDSEALQSP